MCSHCKLSARCLPQGVERMFEEVFWETYFRTERPASFFKVVLVATQTPYVDIAAGIERVYRDVAEQFPCELIPGISLIFKEIPWFASREARIKFSLRRKSGYQRLQDLPLQFSLSVDRV